MARKVSYTLTRTNAAGKVHTVPRLDKRDMGQCVAWCARDNLGLTHAEASRHGVSAESALTSTGTYTLGEYTYVATVENRS